MLLCIADDDIVLHAHAQFHRYPTPEYPQDTFEPLPSSLLETSSSSSSVRWMSGSLVSWPQLEPAEEVESVAPFSRPIDPIQTDTSTSSTQTHRENIEVNSAPTHNYHHHQLTTNPTPSTPNTTPIMNTQRPIFRLQVNIRRPRHPNAVEEIIIMDTHRPTSHGAAKITDGSAKPAGTGTANKSSHTAVKSSSKSHGALKAETIPGSGDDHGKSNATKHRSEKKSNGEGPSHGKSKTITVSKHDQSSAKKSNGEGPSHVKSKAPTDKKSNHTIQKPNHAESKGKSVDISGPSKTNTAVKSAHNSARKSREQEHHGKGSNSSTPGPVSSGKDSYRAAKEAGSKDGGSKGGGSAVVSIPNKGSDSRIGQIPSTFARGIHVKSNPREVVVREMTSFVKESKLANADIFTSFED